MKKILSLKSSLILTSEQEISRNRFWSEIDQLASQVLLSMVVNGESLDCVFDAESFLGPTKSKAKGSLANNLVPKGITGFFAKVTEKTDKKDPKIAEIDYLNSDERPLDKLLNGYGESSYFQALKTKKKSEESADVNTTLGTTFLNHIRTVIQNKYEQGQIEPLFPNEQFDSNRDSLIFSRENRAQSQFKGNIVDLMVQIVSLSKMDSETIGAEQQLIDILDKISQYFQGKSDSRVNKGSIREEIYLDSMIRDVFTKFGERSCNAIQYVFEENGKDKESLLKLYVLARMRQYEANVPVREIVGGIHAISEFEFDINKKPDPGTRAEYYYAKLTNVLNTYSRQLISMQPEHLVFVKTCVVEAFMVCFSKIQKQIAGLKDNKNETRKDSEKQNKARIQEALSRGNLTMPEIVNFAKSGQQLGLLTAAYFDIAVNEIRNQGAR